MDIMIITAAKEEVRLSDMSGDTSAEGEGGRRSQIHDFHPGD